MRPNGAFNTECDDIFRTLFGLANYKAAACNDLFSARDRDENGHAIATKMPKLQL